MDKQQAIERNLSGSSVVSSNSTIWHDGVAKNSSFDIHKLNCTQEIGFIQVGTAKQTPRNKQLESACNV